MKKHGNIFALVSAVLLLCSAHVYAQLPSGTIIHLQGDAGLVEASGKITEWHDVSNPTVKFVAPLAENQPVKTTATVNGHTTVTFDGAANYLEGPSIFPVNKDYTICVVAKITNYGLNNNIISGNTHAFFFGGGIYPRFLHANFNSIATSSVAVNLTSHSVMIARYNQSNQTASFMVNGYAGDSGIVGANTDTVAFIGAFQRTAFFGGELAEVFVFPRYLSDAELGRLQDSLFKKYAITGPLPPDHTFTKCPQPLQLYVRDADDSATVDISATLTAKGFDSAYVAVTKRGEPFYYASKLLLYSTEGAPISFNPRIHAELSEYSFIVGVKSSTRDSVLRHSDSVVCGDVFFVNGQSNSIFGGDTYSNEYCRSYGGNASASSHDTLWALSSAIGSGGGTSVGAWPLRVQKNIIEQLHVPSALISGGVGGTSIEQHLPVVNNPGSLQSIYGSMLFRANKSGLAKRAKAMFWYQGESNSITNYFDNFRKLYSAWHLDYPKLEKIYVMQVRPGCNSGTAGEVRDLLRSLPDFFPDITAHTTMGLPGHDGCHFVLDNLAGYHNLGDQAFNLLNQDFYHSSDTIGIHSPNIRKAFFTAPDHKSVALVFATSGSSLVLPKDTVIGDVAASLKDYFYLGTDTSIVASMNVHIDTLFLTLSRPTAARYITYLPDQVYNGSTVTYEGPWLFNSRGLGAFSFYNVPVQEYSDASVADGFLDLADVRIYPNPSIDIVDVEYSLTQVSPVRIDLRNMLGQVVFSSYKAIEQQGKHTRVLDVSTLPNGTYLLGLEIGGSAIVKHIRVLR